MARFENPWKTTNRWGKGGNEYDKWFSTENPVLQTPSVTTSDSSQNIFKVKGTIISFQIWINDALVHDPIVNTWLPLTFKSNLITGLLPKENVPKAFFRLSVDTTVTTYSFYFNPQVSSLITVEAENIKRLENNLSISQVDDSNLDDVSKFSWGETAGAYPTLGRNNLYKPEEWVLASTEQLLRARAAIDLIGTSGRNQRLQEGTPDITNATIKKLAAYHLKSNFPSVDKEIANNPNVRWFFLDTNPKVSHTGINNTQKIVKIYGPFFNTTGGDVPSWSNFT